MSRTFIPYSAEGAPIHYYVFPQFVGVAILGDPRVGTTAGASETVAPYGALIGVSANLSLP